MFTAFLHKIVRKKYAWKSSCLSDQKGRRGMVDRKATVRFLQFIKLYKVKPTAGIDDFDFWKSQQSYTDQTLKHKMQNFYIMDELPTHFALVKHPWMEIYLTDISLSWNMDLHLFYQHALYKCWLCITFWYEAEHQKDDLLYPDCCPVAQMEMLLGKRA